MKLTVPECMSSASPYLALLLFQLINLANLDHLDLEPQSLYLQMNYSGGSKNELYGWVQTSPGPMSRARHWDGRCSQNLHQRLLNAAHLALHVNSMDQEFVAMLGQFLQGLLGSGPILWVKKCTSMWK